MYTHINDSEDECPGQGKCHGCLHWCNNCGNVTHVCDVRLELKRCDAHPMPPEWGELAKRRNAAEHKLWQAQQLEHEARGELGEIQELEVARAEYTKQRHEDERRLFMIGAA